MGPRRGLNSGGVDAPAQPSVGSARSAQQLVPQKACEKIGDSFPLKKVSQQNGHNFPLPRGDALKRVSEVGDPKKPF